MQISGFELLLPEGVLEYFEILKVDQSKTETSIFLQEKNIICFSNTRRRRGFCGSSQKVVGNEI